MYGRQHTSDIRKERQQIIQDVRGQLEEKAFQHHQARFAGEMRLILALALLLEDWMEEAQSRLMDAEKWFEDHPTHPLHAEFQLVKLVFTQHELQRDRETTHHPTVWYQKFEGKTNAGLKKCRVIVQQMSGTFEREKDQHAYCTHHRVERLIKVFVDVEISEKNRQR